MHSLICQLVMISVLFLSVDGAFDRISEGHPHGGEMNIELASNVCTLPDTDGVEHIDLNPDHCEHCCHGHATSIAVKQHSVMPYPRATAQQRHAAILAVIDGQAPPTPPPNA